MSHRSRATVRTGSTLRRASLVTAALTAGALLLTACGSASGGESADAAKDVVNVVTPAQPETLDPQISTESIMGEITGPIFETLLTVDANLAPQPMLAESFERSDDGLSYTFHLREGVKFQDGSELDADDVVASMERWNRVSISAEGAFDGAKWAKVDASTVTLTVPTASFLHLLYLSNIAIAYPAIMPAEVIEKFGDNPVEDIVGTGPYALKEWDADRQIVLEKWDGYQSRSEASSGRSGAKNATLNEIVFSFVADSSTRTMGMQSGQYDVTPELPFDGLTQFQDDPNLVLDTYTISPINLVYSDRAGGPFANVANRQAVNTALDRDPIMLGSVGSAELYDLVHHNMTKPQQAIWDTEVGKADFNTADTAKAKELLKKGGYNGEPVTLLVTRDYTEAYNAAVVVAEQLKALGMDVKLEALEWASYFDKYKEGRDEWDLTIIPQGTETDPTQTVGFLPNRAGYYDTPELKDLLARFRAAPTQADASKMFDEMQEYIETYRPLSRLGDAHNVYAANKDLDLPVFDSHFLWWNAGWKDAE